MNRNQLAAIMPSPSDAPSSGVLSPMTDLLSALTGSNTTSDWDVLVSYNVTKLNAVFASLWKGNIFTGVVVDRDYLDLSIRTVANLDIGAPTITFEPGRPDGSGSSGWLSSTTAQGISFALACIGFTGFTLAVVAGKVLERLKKKQDPAPAVNEAQPAAAAIVQREVEAVPPPEPSPQVAQMLQDRFREASQSQSFLSESDHVNLVAEIGEAAGESLKENSEREIIIYWYTNAGDALDLLPNSGADVVSQQASALADAAVPHAFRDELVEANATSAKAQKAASAAMSNQAAAIREATEKQGESAKLQNERTELENELQSAKRSQPDDTTRATDLEKQIADKVMAIERAEKAQQEAEAKQAEAEVKAKEANDDAAAADERAREVQPELKPDMPK